MSGGIEDAPPGGPVDVRTRFDQFPATIKGAFVLRGADGNPHAVDLLECSVARIPAGEARQLALGRVRVDVAPGRDLFVPFEVGIGDLEPGWYAVRSAIRVDAGETWSFSSRGFSVPWPRDAVRRGTVKLGQAVRSGRQEYLVEGIDMRSDRAMVSWRPAGDTPGRLDVLLLADGRELEAIPADARSSRPESGSARHAVFYPVPRGTGSLVIELRSAARSTPQRINVPLS